MSGIACHLEGGPDTRAEHRANMPEAQDTLAPLTGDFVKTLMPATLKAIEELGT
jgi:hypothetical protein